MIVYGIAKKMVIADNVAIHVNEIFVEGAPLDNLGLVWWGALAFGIQIYCDFSAYTDIAIGSALLFGIRLPENFDAPYAAKDRLKISGGVGTSLFPHGFEITCTSH